MALKRYRDAERQLSPAYAIYKAQDHPSATDLQQISRDLLAAYAALDEKDKALRLRAEIANVANSTRAAK